LRDIFSKPIFYCTAFFVVKFGINLHEEVHSVDKGTAAEFRRRFELPILKGRDASATDAEHERGKEKLQEVLHRWIYLK